MRHRYVYTTYYMSGRKWVLNVLTLGMAQAEPRQRNYVLRRQQAFPSLGTPTIRMNYGRRQIDYYRAGNGVWLLFEGDSRLAQDLEEVPMTRATSSRWLAGSSRNRRSCSLGKRLVSPCLCPTGLVGRVGHSRGATMLPNKRQETLMQKKLIIAMVGVGKERP